MCHGIVPRPSRAPGKSPGTRGLKWRWEGDAHRVPHGIIRDGRYLGHGVIAVLAIACGVGPCYPAIGEEGLSECPDQAIVCFAEPPVAGRPITVASGTTPLLDRGILHMSSKSNPEILAKVAYLEFIQLIQKRGKALLVSLVELQVELHETPFEPRRFHVVDNPRELSDGIWSFHATSRRRIRPDQAIPTPRWHPTRARAARHHLRSLDHRHDAGADRLGQRRARRPRRRPNRGRFYRCRWANGGQLTLDEVANPCRDWSLRQVRTVC